MLEVVRRGYCLGYWENIAFSVWHSSLNREHVPEMKTLYEGLRSKHPQGFAAIAIVAKDADPVAADARKPLASLYESLGTSLKGVSVVLEADGVKGATLRFVLNGMRLVIGSTYPIEVHASDAQGASWLEEKLDCRNTARELSKQIADYERERARALA